MLDLVSMELAEWSEEYFGFDVTRTSLVDTQWEEEAVRFLNSPSPPSPSSLFFFIPDGATHETCGKSGGI